MADELKTRLAVGVMTGTSLDGMDAALVRIRGNGLCMRAELVRHTSQPLGRIAATLRSAAEQSPMTAGEFARLAWEFGSLHAEVIGTLMGHEHVDLICVHGQTVFHQPPISWQLVNAAPIAARFKCPIVSDLRQLDLAAGGQGAPITPLADWIMFRNADKRRAIINLGGFCNVTILPRAARQDEIAAGAAELDSIRGFDVCACNQVLDAVARSALGRPYDHDGERALSGGAKPQAAEALSRILNDQRRAKRSLGTGDEASRWLADQLSAGTAGDDIAASAVDAIACCIVDAVHEHGVEELILAGGGARNLALQRRIAGASRLPVRLSDDLGVPLEARESMAFAVLGGLCADGVPITLSHVTGCRAPAPISGSWTNVHLLHRCAWPIRG